MTKKSNIKPGDFYEDCAYHPVLCVRVTKDNCVEGISLVDGSYPRCCDIHHCAPRKITLKEALDIKFNGPSKDKKEHVRALEKDGWRFHKWWKEFQNGHRAY